MTLSVQLVFKSFRNTVGYPCGPKAEKQPDKMNEFLAGTTQAGEDVFRLCSSLIYSRDHDDTWAKALEKKHLAKDVLRSSPIKEWLEEIKEVAKTHKVQTDS